MRWIFAVVVVAFLRLVFYFAADAFSAVFLGTLGASETVLDSSLVGHHTFSENMTFFKKNDILERSF